MTQTATPTPRWLDDREQSAWRAYLDMNAKLIARLNKEMQEQSGLSISDFSVLVALSEHVDGRMRVLELARALGWEKSRLSHQLTRMQQRDLIDRVNCSEDRRGAFVAITAAGGLIVVAAFTALERRLASGTALMDMALWRLRAFSWGTAAMALATLLGIVAMFTMPQYFSAVLGADALGSGLRLMPLLGGIVIGIAAGVVLSERISYKAAVTTGLACLTAGGLLAARTTVETGFGAIAGWLALFGFGFGAVMIAGQNLALNTLDESRAGVGGAIVQVMRQTGSVIGIAALGSALNAAYRDNVGVARLPGASADAVRGSVEAGLAIAHQVNSPELTRTVKNAFIDGVHLQMWLSAALAATCILGTLIAMPARLGKTEDRVEADPAQVRAREDHTA